MSWEDRRKEILTFFVETESDGKKDRQKIEDEIKQLQHEIEKLQKKIKRIPSNGIRPRTVHRYLYHWLSNGQTTMLTNYCDLGLLRNKKIKEASYYTITRKGLKWLKEANENGQL